MKIVFNTLVVIAFAGLFTACQSELDVTAETSTFNIVDDRIAFDTEADAIKTLETLGKMDEKALSNWEMQNNAKSFRTTMNVHSTAPEDTTLAFYSPALAAILNANRQYQAGDSIIWFHGNYVFKLPKDDPQLLSAIVKNPEDNKFLNFRHTFQNRRQADISTGRMTMPGRSEAVILDELAQTPPFKLNGTLDYRFRWDLMHQYSGVNFQMIFVVCLQYRANNGGWYLAGETTTEKRVSSGHFTPQAGWNYTYSYVTTGAVSFNDNGYLQMALVQSSTASQFQGQISATFKGVVTGSAGTFSFNQQVQWM
jgi:hypothetical protein